MAVGESVCCHGVMAFVAGNYAISLSRRWPCSGRKTFPPCGTDTAGRRVGLAAARRLGSVFIQSVFRPGLPRHKTGTGHV